MDFGVYALGSCFIRVYKCCMTWNSYGCSCLPAPQKTYLQLPRTFTSCKPYKEESFGYDAGTAGPSIVISTGSGTQTEKGPENEMVAGLCFAKVCMT